MLKDKQIHRTFLKQFNGMLRTTYGLHILFELQFSENHIVKKTFKLKVTDHTHFYGISVYSAIPENIHTPPMDDTELGT